MTIQNLSFSVAEALLRTESGPEHEGPGRTRGRPHYCIAVSREVGALGESVAREVGRRLECPVYDREIVERIAEELRQPTSALQNVDERPTSWLEDLASGLLGQNTVSPDTFLRYLVVTLRGMAAVGRCVLVGRGAAWILPAASTLRVRLVADTADRLKAVRQKHNFTEEEARTWMDRTEAERTEFARRYFKADPADPHRYDVVLNTSRLSVSEAADVIVQTFLRLEARVGSGSA